MLKSLLLLAPRGSLPPLKDACCFSVFVRQVISPQTLLIESSAGSKSLKQATVTVRNTGSTVLFFSWSRVPRGETVVSTNGAFSADEGGSGESVSDQDGVLGEAAAQRRNLSTGGKVGNAAARHAALQSPDSRFFCVQVTQS